MASLFQFSIRSLLVAVTIAAVGVAALLNANVWWQGATWLVALLLLGAGILLVVYRRGEQRAYWLGFVIFGGLYLGMIVLTGLSGKQDVATSQLSTIVYGLVIPDSQQAPLVQIATTGATPVYAVAPMTYSGPYLSAPQPVPSLAPAIMPPAATTIATWNANPDHVSLDKFVSIGHSLWLLLAAAFGGKLCQWISRTRAPDE